MVCSARAARCGPRFPTLVGPGGAATSDVLLALLIGSAIGLPVALLLNVLFAPELAIGAAAAAGALAGLIAALIAYVVMMLIIAVTVWDRCRFQQGRTVCAVGVISHIEENDRPSFAENLFPFTMMHDRVDIVTQSFFWDDIERDEAFVFCTPERSERTSEILRCYYEDPQICAAGYGALVGGGVVGFGGVIVGTLAAAAIGCATVFFCILALLVAILIVVAFVLIGAVIGSQIGRAVETDRSPRSTLELGDFIVVGGNLLQRGFDLDANVLWWTQQTACCGGTPGARAPRATWSRSHCELDELPNLCLPPPP